MFRVLEFNGKSVEERDLQTMSNTYLRWIDLISPSPDDLRLLAAKVGVPVSDLEEATDPEERPRVEELGRFTEIVFRVPAKSNEHSKRFVTGTLGIFISEKVIITIHQEPNEQLVKLTGDREKIAWAFTRGVTGLLVEILARSAHEYVRILDYVESEINRIEDLVFEDPQRQTVRQIFTLKKTLIFFHKALTTNLDVVYKLEKDPSDLIDITQVTRFRYVHDEILQLVDMVATYRDLLTGTLDIYLSSVSNNMNAIMKRMTAWASLILIPTFITGLYGMNFTYMPEIDWQYGYVFAWGTIVVSVLLLFWYFKKKDWF